MYAVTSPISVVVRMNDALKNAIRAPSGNRATPDAEIKSAARTAYRGARRRRDRGLCGVDDLGWVEELAFGMRSINEITSSKNAKNRINRPALPALIVPEASVVFMSIAPSALIPA